MTIFLLILQKSQQNRFEYVSIKIEVKYLKINRIYECSAKITINNSYTDYSQNMVILWSLLFSLLCVKCSYLKEGDFIEYSIPYI